jgi:hypothetical protein
MLQSGARVRVHGLQAAAAQRHNGAEAIVVEHAAATERATVRLLSGEVLRAKPTNLAPRTDCSLCKKASNALKACSQCGIASYCSKQCQVRLSLRFCVPRSKPDAEGVLAIPRRRIIGRLGTSRIVPRGTRNRVSSPPSSTGSQELG